MILFSRRTLVTKGARELALYLIAPLDQVPTALVEIPMRFVRSFLWAVSVAQWLQSSFVFLLVDQGKVF